MDSKLKILEEPNATVLFTFVKLIGALYLLSRTVKTVYEIREHMERKEL